MDRLLVGLIVLAAYIILGTAVAIASRKRLEAGEEGFYIAKGRLGSFLSAMTYAATTYSSFMIVGLVGFAYSTGVGALGFELIYLISTLGLLTVFSRRVWRRARERGWVSPGEMLADIYGSRMVAVVASIIFLVSLVPYASAQLKGIGEAVAGLAGGGDQYYTIGVLLGVAVMLVWSLVAGIWSVAATDALQGLWMLIAGTMLLLWLVAELRSSGLGVVEAFRVLEEAGLAGPGGFWSIHIFLAFTIPWMFFAVTNPQVVQRLFMPRDEGSLRNMVRWFGVFGLYYTVLVVLVGLLARAAYEAGVLGISVDPADPAQRDRVTPSLLYIASPLLASIVFTSIVAASISTVDSILLTLSSSISRDLGAGRRAGLAGLIVVAGVLAGVALARLQYIVLLSVLSSLMLLSLAPATISGWLGRRGDPRLVAASMLAGPVIVAIAAVTTGSVKAAFVSRPMGVPISIWILAVSTLLVLVAGRIRGS